MTRMVASMATMTAMRRGATDCLAGGTVRPGVTPASWVTAGTVVTVIAVASRSTVTSAHFSARLRARYRRERSAPVRSFLGAARPTAATTAVGLAAGPGDAC